jgi:hypothetical protein
MSPLHYIRSKPFSTMALCNILGDLSLLGFAFKSAGWVSIPKLIGALFTMIAHIILLAYGERFSQGPSESGFIPNLISCAQARARVLTSRAPVRVQTWLRARPIAITFSMLALNGAGLLIDALVNINAESAPAAKFTQILLGSVIFLGCLTYASSDLHATQRGADQRLRLGAIILTTTVAPQLGLAIATHSAFLVLALGAFVGSNLAGFYAKRQPREP